MDRLHKNMHLQELSGAVEGITHPEGHEAELTQRYAHTVLANVVSVLALLYTLKLYDPQGSMRAF